jgi:aminoglycoside phosphotransferase
VLSVGWLPDPSEESLRSALAVGAPGLAKLPLAINRGYPSSNPLWWSASAVVDGRFVVKYAWSEVRAVRLWREGVLLERLWMKEPSMPIPELVALSREPALVVTWLVVGAPLSWEWASCLTPPETKAVAGDLARFLVQLHGICTDVVCDLPVVDPKPQADTERLRDRFLRLVDEGRGAAVLRWCDWVDDVLRVGPNDVSSGVLVHGDLHGYNQVWDEACATLLAVVDFEESGIADAHFDLRYLPGNAQSVDLVLAVMAAYEQLSGTRLAIDRVMAWHVLTVLGDALWRTEAGVALPGGGGSAATWVDDLGTRLDTLNLA